MLEGGGQLGEAAVDVYANLTRLDADLAEARRKVDKWAADTQAQIGGAVQRAGQSGVLPQRQLDDFAAKMSGVFGNIARQADAAMGKVAASTDQVAKKAADGVADIGKASADATAKASAGVDKLNSEVGNLATNINRVNAAGAAATSRAGAGVGGRASGVGAAAAGRAATKEAQDLDRAVENLAKSYSPLHAAQIRYVQDLEKIQGLQNAGIFSANDAAMFTRKASEELRRASDEQSKVFQFAQRAGEQIRQYSGIAVLAFGVAAVAAVRSSLQQVQAIKATADQLHMSTTAWQEWSYIANQVNVPLGKVEQGFETLQNTMGRAATGSARDAKLFKELGISLTDTNGKAKDTNAVMRELADTLPRVADENQRAAAMQKLFGQNAAEFSKLLAGGSSEINRLRDAAYALGVVLSEEEIKNADRAAQKLEDLKTVLSADVSRAVANNANAIISLASALTQLASGIIAFMNTNPRAALAIIGALAGGAVGGPVGALLGAAGGVVAGQTMARSRDDSNMNVAHRLKRLNESREQLRQAQEKDHGGIFELHSGTPSPAGVKGANDEVRRQMGLLAAARAAQRGDAPAAPKGPPISLSDFNAPKPRTPRAAKATAGRPDGYEKELANLEMQLLQALGAQVTNAAARATIDLAILDAQKRRYNAGIDMDVQTKRYTAAEGELLKAKYTEIDAAKRLEVQHRMEDQQNKDRVAVGEAGTRAREEILGTEKQLARTTGKRRTIELELLDLSHKMEAAQLDATIAANDSSDTEKEIAETRKKHLEELKGLQRQIILRETQGPVADFFESIPQTADEVAEALQRMRAANLEDMRNRAVNFADSIGEAFGNMTRNIFALESPLKILQSLLADLAHTFTEETVVRPVKEWATRKIGGPLAERFVGAPAGPEGLSWKAIETASLTAATKIDQLGMAAAMTAQRMNTGAGSALWPVGGGGDENLSIAAPVDMAAIAQEAIAPFSSEITNLTSGLTAANREVNNFGSALPQAVQQVLSMAQGGGGGGSGLLGAVLQIGIGAISGGITAGTAARLAPDVASTIAANPGIFHSGGEIGLDARPIRRALRPGERNITARVGEGVINEQAMKRLPPGTLDSINAGRLSSLGGMNMQSFSSVDRSMHIRLGDVIVQDSRGDDRSARRTGKQVGAAQNQQIARAAKQGIFYRDR